MEADIREKMWERASELLFGVEREDWLRDLEEWSVDPMLEGAFAFVHNGSEFHVVSLEEGHRFPLKDMLRRIDAIIDRYGHAKTRTPKHETKQLAVNDRLGWERVEEDEFDVIYRVNRCR